MKPCPNCSRPMFVNSKYKICEHCRESKKDPIKRNIRMVEIHNYGKIDLKLVNM